MGQACTHPRFPQSNGEHPIVAWLAVIAMVAAILLIAWARLEVHGVDDIEAVLVEPSASDLPLAEKPEPKSAEELEVDAAVTSSRFATGFSP